MVVGLRNPSRNTLAEAHRRCLGDGEGEGGTTPTHRRRAPDRVRLPLFMDSRTPVQENCGKLRRIATSIPPPPPQECI